MVWGPRQVERLPEIAFAEEAEVRLGTLLPFGVNDGRQLANVAAGFRDRSTTGSGDFFRAGVGISRIPLLLKADADGPAWTDQKIAEAFNCRVRTVENIRQRCVLQGFEQALDRKPSQAIPANKLLNGKQEAKIIALRLGPAPKGYSNWTLRLLARQVVALEIVKSISHETVRGTLKKMA